MFCLGIGIGLFIGCIAVIAYGLCVQGRWFS